jgi:formylglycine-generating enzyme required for sulfatase activity
MKKIPLLLMAVLVLGSCATNASMVHTNANMVHIEGGIFTMGSPNDEEDRDSDEVQHSVTVSSFYISKFEVTQKEWQETMENNPSNFKGDNLPVEMVTWFDVIEYCIKRSQNEGLTPAYVMSGRTPENGYPITSANVTWNQEANGYRLPTEAEWEYAARAGTETPYSSGNDVDNSGWYNSNSEDSTHQVGTKQANRWGLYDMHGNVYEWCWDWYEDYIAEAQVDPTGAPSGSYRVVRGGCWDRYAQHLRSAARFYRIPSRKVYVIGFRLVTSKVLK